MFDPDNCILLIIDIQGKLSELVLNSSAVIKNTAVLAQTANYLNIPIIYTEQVPEKIGATVNDVKKHLQEIDPITKRTFSCCGEQKFIKSLSELNRNNIIVVGMEAHVCVYQTVYDLISKNYIVKVVKDAVSSRNEDDYNIAMHHMDQCKAQMTTTEMILCELIKSADHERFKDIMAFLKT
ncbi:MAG: nicotinamidase-related amidase [Candidatus Omnitrophota bacterium]|jgi:nicotinamidase-related amidase